VYPIGHILGPLHRITPGTNPLDPAVIAEMAATILTGKRTEGPF
jgi:hypothetical protein